MHLVLSRERHQLDQRILLVAAAGPAVGETRRDLSRPALLTYCTEAA
jgi:hypothetical protein